MSLSILVAAFLVAFAAAHGTLTKPITRNRGPLDVKGPADYQSGNGGGKGFNAGYKGGSGSSPCGVGIWGFSNNQGGGAVGWHYRGGDAQDASLHTAYKMLLKDYNSALTEDVRQAYVQGENIHVQAQITAYHGGYMTFHLCPVMNGELDFDVADCGLLEPAGSAAHSTYLLRNLSSATLPVPSEFCTNCDVDSTASGFCGYNPGCMGEGPDGFAVLDITLEPSQVAMDHGVLVWHWFTANNGEGFVGGEEFMNCADVRIRPSGSSPVTTDPPVTTLAPSVTTTAAPETTTTDVPLTTPIDEPATTTPSGAFVECDNGEGSCKDQCSKACGYNVQINQCWGHVRYIQCECKDGSTHIFPGCECENSQCLGSGTSPTPTPPSPTPAPITLAPSLAPTPNPATPAPTSPSPGGMVCKGNPDKWTTDAQCAPCETGYLWWPCNVDHGCLCTASLSQRSSHVESRAREVKAKKSKFLSSEDVMMQMGTRSGRPMLPLAKMREL